MCIKETRNTIELKLKNNFWIQFNNCEKSYLDSLYKNFSDFVDGYFFMPRFKSGIWDGKISIFNKVDRTLPYGLFVDFLKFHKQEFPEIVLDVDPLIKNKFSGVKELPWKWDLKYQPRYYQEDIIKKCIQYRSCIVESCTRSGKSLSLTFIFKHLLENNLIQKPLLIVPRIDLVRQFKNDMLEYGIDESLIGCVWGEEKEFDKPITISTWQSLIFIEDRFKNELLENSGIDSHQQKSLKEKRKILKNFESPFTRYDSVAIDEVHKSGTDNKLHWILQQCVNATWRFGFTGTLPDGNLSLWNVKSYLGPVVCSYKTEELRQKGYIANCKVHFTNIHYKKKEFEGQEINKENIFKLPKRIDIIKNIIKKVPNKPIVLLVDTIQKDGKFLENALKQDIELVDREIVFIKGSVKVSEREKWYEKCRNGENVILIAMFQILQEGLTIPCLSDLVFASPCSSKIRVLQSIGRTLGTHYSKVNANIYDLVDHTTGYVGGKKAGATRFKYYMKEKFEVIETEI